MGQNERRGVPPGVCVQTRTHVERECEKIQFMIIFFSCVFMSHTNTISNYKNNESIKYFLARNRFWNPVTSNRGRRKQCSWNLYFLSNERLRSSRNQTPLHRFSCEKSEKIFHFWSANKRRQKHYSKIPSFKLSIE